ncbi:MAG: hypothetical protein E7253_09990 [Lachnospiraceae bacterium]|nr:hypothetical protein [Lachnospiraceae bacterium]
MSETQANSKSRIIGLLSRILAAVIGWSILTIVNFLPLWLENPLVEKYKISGGYDVNIMEEYTFETGLFKKRINENGNLSAGAALIQNDTAAYFTVDEVICELDLEKMESRDLEGKATSEPHFCDDEVYLSTAYLGDVAVGLLGDGSPQIFEEKWYDDINSFDQVQRVLFNLLKKSDTEELSTAEMAKLVGYTVHGELVGWDGETAIFCLTDDTKGRIIFQKYREEGIVDVIPGSCSNPGVAMISGNTAIYRDGNMLKTLNLETFEEKTVSDPVCPVVYFNHMNLDGHRILIWIGTDGMHTLDLDQGNINFVKGNWYSDYRGLYIWKNHIIALRNDRGFYKWSYTN